MDFSLSEEQKQIKALIREFCQREVDQNRLTLLYSIYLNKMSGGF